MQIIGHTQGGYLIEADSNEIESITGKDACNRSGWPYRPTLPVGTKIEVREAYQHIDRVTRFEAQRKGIAEQLRAAATVIETTPSVLEIPIPAQSIAEELREALA